MEYGIQFLWALDPLKDVCLREREKRGFED